jgi:hypothetical protein
VALQQADTESASLPEVSRSPAHQSLLLEPGPDNMFGRATDLLLSWVGAPGL